MDKVKKSGRKVAVALVGFPVIALGFIMLVTPGPGLLLIAAGLAILSLEFEFAERYLKAVRQRIKQAAQKVRGKKNG